jgi:hypothetical protein
MHSSAERNCDRRLSDHEGQTNDCLELGMVGLVPFSLQIARIMPPAISSGPEIGVWPP